jgi:peptidoglycan/xylan/chitin deacetylase (PgdA/CDA1 family)
MSLLAVAAAVLMTAPPPPTITGYHVERVRLGTQLALRSFTRSGVRQFLVVDPRTLRTSVVTADAKATPFEWPRLESSPYVEALRSSRQHDAALQDAGLTHLLPGESGVVLTVDLCPSRRPFEMRLVTRLRDAVEPAERPVPIAFSISGVWLREHPDTVRELRALDGRDLDITWINHSMNHRFSRRAPLTQNFMLEPGTNVASEVLDAEVAMLEAGLTPSVFFRFPGLVSEPTLVDAVTELGLIVVGSDAWLAKGQPAHDGSIVLVHGNGNEPRGIDAFLALLKREGRAIAARQFLLVDLRDELEREP